MRPHSPSTSSRCLKRRARSASTWHRPRPARSSARAVGQALDALTERPTPERVASFEALVLGLRRLGLRFGLWQTQNRFFALWRDQPEARDTLRPLADALGFALAAKDTR